MTLLLVVFIGGVLSILSPCILPVIPFVFARGDQPFVRSGLPRIARCCSTVGFSKSLPKPADTGGDVHRFDVGDLIEVGARFAPGEEAPAGVEIGGAGVRVLDRDGEEFEEAARAVVAGGGNQRGRHGRPSVGDARHGAGFG
jgi:hypothetical protein